MISQRWNWKTKYCKDNGLPPAENWAWAEAERAYQGHLRGIDQGDETTPTYVGDVIRSFAETKFQLKDAEKFSKCNKLISRGCPGSSSYVYGEILKSAMLGIRLNFGSYCENDIVAISVNGLRVRRIKFDRNEVGLAMLSRCTIVTDDIRDRMRAYNIGEREVAEYLFLNGYRDTFGNGLWNPK